MIELNTIWNIYIEGIDAIRRDSEGRKIVEKSSKRTFNLLWYFLPLLTIVFVFYKQIQISYLQNFVGSSIALFTGLFFSLLLRIGDKIRSEKNNQDRDLENFLRFKESLRQISKISQLIILIGITVFILLVLNGILRSDSCPIIELIISSISLAFLVWYLLALLTLIQRFTYTMRDEIENIL